MNMKKRIARVLFMLTFTGTILKIPLRAQAVVPWQAAHENEEAAAVSQAAYENEDAGTAGMPPQAYAAVQTEFIESAQAAAAAKQTGTVLKKSLKSAQTAEYHLSDSEWADSGSDYYFSLLNTREKKLYLNLKQAADNYMTGTDNFQMTKLTRSTGEVQICILPMVSYQGLTTEQMKKVFYCFLFENPQYYFMRNSVIYSEKSETMTIGLYDAFANGSVRAGYTADFAAQLAQWDAQIAAAQTTVEKEQLIHQIVCSHVSYNYNDDDDPDDRFMGQSCISAVLFERSTVCTGYAQLFSLLCNRTGIECVTVTSAGHAWNKVRMGGIWYNVDCTWDDSRGDQAFLNLTDEQLISQDTKLAEHALSAEWQGLAPICIQPFDIESANGEDSGSNILASDKTVSVTLKNREKGQISVEFEPIAGCDGYTFQYALNANMESSKKKEAEEGPYVLTGLKSGKTYYVRVRAYTLDSSGNKLYGAFSKKQKITVK